MTEPREELLVPVNRWPLILAVLAFGALLFYLLRPILLPFILGGVIGYLGDPLVDRLERRKINRTVGVVLVFLLLTLLIALFLLVAVPALFHQIDGLIQKLPVMIEWISGTLVPWLREHLSSPGLALPDVDWSKELLRHWQSMGKVMVTAISGITGSGANLLLGLTNAVLVPVVAFYLMRDWDGIMDRLLNLLPKAWQESTVTMVGEADEVVGAFLRGQFLVMCSLGVIYGTGLWLVGVQLSLVLGVIAGLASIVPYLGFVVGICASLLAAWLQFHDVTMLAWVVLVFGIGQLLESMVLTPILVGDRIGLHPVAVIFALMAGGQLAGFVGILVALPVAAVIMVFVRHALAHYRDSHLYSAD